MNDSLIDEKYKKNNNCRSDKLPLLHCTAIAGNTELCKFLIDLDAKTNVKNCYD
ncbi:hypothetical protein GF322_04935 [Candidatus Dependentiae bacterium]|nr:hypothetical protein [Candidatus Dependentiae bacterium]